MDLMELNSMKYSYLIVNNELMKNYEENNKLLDDQVWLTMPKNATHSNIVEYESEILDHQGTNNIQLKMLLLFRPKYRSIYTTYPNLSIFSKDILPDLYGFVGIA
jgi:hypothetical protein